MLCIVGHLTEFVNNFFFRDDKNCILVTTCYYATYIHYILNSKMRSIVIAMFPPDEAS